MSKIHKNRIYALRSECLDFEAEALAAQDFRAATIAAFGAGVALADLVTEELKRMTRAEFGDFRKSTGSAEYVVTSHDPHTFAPRPEYLRLVAEGMILHLEQERRLTFVTANRGKARATVIAHLKSGRSADAKRRTQRECRATVLQWMRNAEAEAANAQH